jgi:hypothetical protein
LPTLEGNRITKSLLLKGMELEVLYILFTDEGKSY